MKPASPSVLLSLRLNLILQHSMNDSIFVRPLGSDPHADGRESPAACGCPDILELADGDFAIIGSDITNLADQLPESAGCGPDERIVRIPRETLLGAKSDIP